MRTWQRLLSFILVFAIAFSFPAPVSAGGNVSGKVLNTISPKDVVPNTPTPFWMDAYNTGNVDWTFTAAMTVRYPDGHDVDYERTSVHLKSGQTGIVTWSLSLPPGDYKVIFGLWKDNKVALGRSEWINFTVSAPLKPITPPPITNPPPVVQMNVAGEITNTVFPNTLFADTSTPFRMDFKNTGNTGWTFVAAMTVRYPDGHDVDYERNPMNLPAGLNGGVAWNVSLPPGNYRVIFGLWKDDQTAITRSSWMDFTVSTPSSPPAVIVSAKIVNVILPKTTVKADEQAIFQVDFVNTGDGAWNFLVSMSVKNPDGRVVDSGKTPVSLVFSRNGSVGFPYTFPSGGEYQVMFGVWRDEKTLLTQSDWLTVSVAEGLRNNNTQTNLSAKITDTVFPSVVTIGKGTEFRIEIKNTGSVAHIFTAVFTTRYPSDSSGDLPKIRISLDPGQSGPVSWSPSFQTQGEHQARFTIWKDDEVFLDRSDWMSFTAKKAEPPPVIPPVVTPPPVTNPPPVIPPVIQTNVSGEITNTIFPMTMVSGNPAAFRMDFKNTGNTGWTFIAAMTIRYPDGHDVDYERISSYAAVGSSGAATWNPSLPPGNYRVIFGLWKDEQTALTRSYWMDFTVSAPPVVSPPPITNPPPVVPPVVTPPVITPPPVTPPVITPPVVNPPPVVPPSTNPRITATSIPSVVTVGDGFVFRMHFSGIPADGSYEAAATIRTAGRQNEDWEKIPLRETAGTVEWYRTFHVTGNFEIIFGIWRDGIPIDRTEWTPLKSLTEEQVFGPSPTARPTVVDAPTIPTSITSPPTEKPIVKEDPIISAEITETRLDLGDWPAFTMSFKNTGNIRHDFFAAMTIKLPDGSVINYGRKEVSLDPGISGKAAWYPLFFPGKYQVIFGIWKGDTPIANSGWILFRVVTDQTDDANETGRHKPSTPISTNKPAAIIVVNNGNKTAGMYDLEGMKSVSLTGKAAFESGVWYLSARSVINAIEGFVNTFRMFPEGTVEDQISVGDQAYIVQEGQSSVMDAAWRVVGSLNVAPKLISGELMLPAEFFTKYLQIAVVDVSESPSSSQEIVLKMGNLLTEQPLMASIFTSTVDDHDVTITSSDIAVSLSGVTRIVQGDPQTLGEFAVSIGLDFVVIGDVLDLGRQGYYFLVSSDDFSVVVLALAASGVLTTLIPEADPFVSAAKSTAKIIGKIAKIDKVVAEPLGKALAYVAKEGDITKLNSLTSLTMKLGKFGELRAFRTLIKNSDDVFRLAEYVGKYGDEGLEFVAEMEKEFQRFVPKIDSGGVHHIWIDNQHRSSFWKTKGIDPVEELGVYLSRFLSDLNGKPVGVYRHWDERESMWVDQFGVYDEVKDIVVAINRKGGKVRTAFPPKGGFSHWLLDSSKHSLPFQIR